MHLRQTYVHKCSGYSKRISFWTHVIIVYWTWSESWSLWCWRSSANPTRRHHIMTQHLLSITSDRNYPKLPFEKHFTKFVGNKIRESLLLCDIQSDSIGHIVNIYAISWPLLLISIVFLWSISNCLFSSIQNFRRDSKIKPSSSLLKELKFFQREVCFVWRVYLCGAAYKIPRDGLLYNVPTTFCL